MNSGSNQNTINEVEDLAKNLLSEVVTKNELAEIINDLEHIQAYLADHEMHQIILNLNLSDREKNNAIKEVMQNCPTRTFIVRNFREKLLFQMHFFLFVESNWKLLREKLVEYSAIQSSLTLTTAISLESKDLKVIQTIAKRKYNKQYFINPKVKPNLIAGFILERGADVIDASLENTLEGYRQEWLKQMVN